MWISRFRGMPKVQLIDLDAAKDAGDNDDLVTRICAELPCRVGGGIRTVGRARDVLEAGATHVILGSSLFNQGRVDAAFARTLAETFGTERLIAAVDSRGGKVVIQGWRTQLEISPVEAVRALEPFFGEFLYTHVDLEGLMQGTDMAAIATIAACHVEEGHGGGWHYDAGRSRSARRPRDRRGRRDGALHRTVENRRAMNAGAGHPV